MRLKAPVVMGVVNVTPDSFSDGGEFLQVEDAAAHAIELADAGAAILDFGGESTRPGADPVDAVQEIARVVPAIEHFRATRPGSVISVDTAKLSVAEAAVDAGAIYINDVTAFRTDPEMAGLVADRNLACCLMHMQGEPRTMQERPTYSDVVDEVKWFLTERTQFAIDEGVPEENIQLDPGIGFGKTLEHNLQLLNRLDEIVAIGRPVVIGTSRKRFLGAITGKDEKHRLAGTIATSVLALQRGAQVFRVHDVDEVSDALSVAAAVLSADTVTP